MAANTHLYRRCALRCSSYSSLISSVASSYISWAIFFVVCILQHGGRMLSTDVFGERQPWCWLHLQRLPPASRHPCTLHDDDKTCSMCIACASTAAQFRLHCTLCDKPIARSTPIHRVSRSHSNHTHISHVQYTHTVPVHWRRARTHSTHTAYNMVNINIHDCHTILTSIYIRHCLTAKRKTIECRDVGWPYHSISAFAFSHI